MQVYVNSQLTEVNSDILLEILREVMPDLSHDGIAIAVNNNVTPRSLWPSTRLHSNDHVLVIKASQGG